VRDKASPPLRGRDQELTRVRNRLLDAAAGKGVVIVVEGRAGLGKTALLKASASMAAGMSFRVGLGMAEPGRSAVELGALLQALFDTDQPLFDTRDLTRLQPAATETFWLLQDIQSLVQEAANDGPLLICLDDLQWAGNSCALAMRQLPSGLATARVAWVLAFRPNEGLPSVLDAKNELLADGAEFISLGPLDRKAITEMAADVLCAQPDQALLEKAEHVHGSPFLLMEFFRGLKAEGLVAIESGQAHLLEDRVPRRVSDSVRSRLSRLSPDAGRVAILAASLARKFSLEELVGLSNQPVTDLVGPVEELMHEDIVVAVDDRLAFGHDLIREGVRTSVASSMRKALDRRAVDVLLSRGALPIEVAHQLAASAEPGDEIAITTLLEATDALVAVDPVAAADLAGRAIQLTTPRHPLVGPLVSRRATSLFAAGSPDEAKRFADSALRAMLPAEDEARVRCSIAEILHLSPDLRADNARAALVLPGLSTELRAQLWAALVHAVVVAGRTDEALQLNPKARAAVKRGRSESDGFVLEMSESVLQYQLGNYQGALETLDAAQRMAPPRSEDPRRRMAIVYRASCLVVLDRFEEAFETVEAALAAAQRDRQSWAVRLFDKWRGRQLLEVGSLADAAASFDGRFSLDQARDIVGPGAASDLVAFGKLQIHGGDDARGAEAARIAEVMLKASSPSVQRHATWYLALYSMYRGDPDRAHKWLCALGYDRRLRAIPTYPIEATDAPQLTRIAMAAGDHALAEASVAEAEERSRLNPGASSLAAAAAHARGLWKSSPDEIATASTLLSGVRRPLALASALEDLGALLAREGAGDEGAASLDRALVINAEVGATWDAARVRSRLRKLGVRRRVASVARPCTGLLSLTTTERAVAELATDGKKDKEIAAKLFISPHTVNTHLRHVYEKLGVNSRLALSKALR
jgi:DNA-binding CsgD family transcriptional regulator